VELVLVWELVVLVEVVDVVLVGDVVVELDEVVVPVEDVDDDDEVDEVADEEVVVAPHADTAIVLAFIVTTPSFANAAPVILAPVFSVMLVKAIILPTNDVVDPIVAELPTVQNTLHA
jgi:hypothetical protein